MNEIIVAIKLSTSIIVSILAIHFFTNKNSGDPFFDLLSALAVGMGFCTSVYISFWASGL